MERNKKTSLLFLLLALTLVCTINIQKCPSRSDGSPLFDTDLICYNDYNNTIICTYESEHADSLCTIHGERQSKYMKIYSSCKLEPVDVSRPKLKKCTMVFEGFLIFRESHVIKINLKCNTMKESIFYRPACYIKLNPPSKPDVNFTTVSNFTTVYNITTVSWVPQVGKTRISLFRSQLQWKQKDQQWSDENKKEMQCKKICRAKLDEDLLIQNEMYEARVRVKTAQDPDYVSNWSDWSRTASWGSPIGKVKPTPPPSDDAQGVMVTVGCVVAFALFLILFKTNKTTWIYVVKRIRGPPIPNPEKSFLRDVNFQNWLSPYFTTESFNSFLKPMDIVSVDVTTTAGAITPRGMEAALLEKMRSESSYESTNTDTDPSNSELSPPPPPIPLLTAGNLEPCGADTPYGPVSSQSEDKTAEQHMVEVRGKEVELLQLLSNGSNNSEPLPVISDYEKVEKPQVERFRLQSLDSGMCSGEEVSQESLEPDSINVTDCYDDGPEGKEESEGRNGKEVFFQKFFGGNRGSFDKGSIQVCSDYERVQKLEDDSSELPSLDSCISSGSEEQVSQEESLEDVDKSTESTSLLFPPPSSSSFLLSSIPLPLDFSGTSLNSALAPLPSHILERIALMSTTKSVEPSGDGYMPVRQDQS